MDERQYIFYLDLDGAEAEDVIEELKIVAREVIQCRIEKHVEDLSDVKGEFVYSGVLYGKNEGKYLNVGILIQKLAGGLTLILRAVGCAELYDVTEFCDYYTGVWATKVVGYYISQIFSVIGTDEQCFGE